MVEKAKSQIGEKVFVGVISTIILAVLAYFARNLFLPLGARVWHGLKGVLVWLSGGSVQSPAWLFCILVVASLGLLIFVMVKIGSAMKVNEPSWRNYLTDSFFGINWRWLYTWDNQIGAPRGYCPNDDTMLVYRKEPDRTYLTMESHAITLHCETCGRQFGPFDGDPEYLIAKVTRQIDRKIRNEEWKSAQTVTKVVT